MDQAAGRRRIFLPVQWLISPASDLSWLLGSVLVAYAMFWAFLSGWLSFFQVSLIWVFMFHGPHFWGTLSRTYADREQFKRRRRLFLGALWWFAVGPVIVGLGLLIQFATPASVTNPSGGADLIRLFFFLAAIWAFHHVVKQHFGFLALYRAKHAEFHKWDFLFHKYYLLISLWMPALIILTNNQDLAMEIPGAYSYVLANGAAGYKVYVSTQEYFRIGCTWTFWSCQGLYVGSLILRLIRGQSLNFPLLLLIACCVPLTWFVIMTSLESKIPFAHLVLVPILTTYHNLQYHGLIWHYNRHKYRVSREDSERRQRHGWAVPLNKNIFVYALFGLIYTLATIGIEKYNLDLSLGGVTWAPVMFQAFFWGFAFHHYYIDSKIWKASEDADLRAVLGFNKPKKPAAAQAISLAAASAVPQPAVAPLKESSIDEPHRQSGTSPA